jgi:methionine synthase / methylenetetrahydrofolate reductase(NADPH)
MNASFLRVLERGPVVCDGGMGTQLYARGVFINRSFDLVNIERPDLVLQIHEEYVKAGAQIIETNTFGANVLKMRRHGVEERTDEVVEAGVRLAREAARGACFVAGAVGPTGLAPAILSDSELEEIRQAYRRQIATLVDSGVDLILLETFRLLSEMRLALAAARAETDLPVIAQMAFDSECLTGDGATPKMVAQRLRDWGADVVGANCVEGPQGIYDAVVQMVGCGAPVSAQPNAGYPRMVDERLIYMSNPDYFAVYARRLFKAGVSLVGGCCGTGPEHVHEIAAAARMMGGGRHEGVEPVSVREPLAAQGREPVPVAERSALARKVRHVYETRVRPGLRPAITRESFVVSVEVNPPQGLDPGQALRGAAMLREAGVDVVNSSDGPRASVRMSNKALAALIEAQVGIEVIVHVCCRDRNLLGLQSDLLAAHVLGLRNLVIITGDPPKMGDYPHATAVYDLDSIGLLRLVSELNRGRDPGGRDMGGTTRFFSACGAEPAAHDYERELRRLEQKKAAGAEMIMTQPVYDPAVLRRFLDDTRELDLPVLVGLLPLASARNAEFLHNEVPGMSVPKVVRDRMAGVAKGAAARQEGVRICQEMLGEVQHDVVGAYIMPPFDRYEAAVQVLEPLGYHQPATARPWP